MTLKNVLKRSGIFILDLFEVYIPVTAFLIMFCIFVLQIFFRYFLNHPLTWPYEVTLFGYIWTVLLGATLARRYGTHVVFSMLYDKISPLGQLAFRLGGNFLILAAFSISLYPCYSYVEFMKIQRSAALRIPFSIAFAPYIPFVILIIGHTAYDIVADIRKLVRKGR
ncbi:MAG: TRAP transporter small permease subunit [Spirochaetota bacterium]